MFSKLKKIFSLKSVLCIIILVSAFGIMTVKAWLEVDPMQITPPDSFIKEGLVLTLIEEDEKYYLKKEYFSATGEYATPASEQQISLEDYSLMRSNRTYDILEKRNRHIVNDVYVDEYHKAYSDNEIMAGNYIAEVLDGFFVDIEYPDGHRSQQVGFINDGGIYYQVTKFVDENGNYTRNASYLLLSQYQYEQAKLTTPYDFEKIVEWNISDDGNTITKTISTYDNAGNYLSRPIVLQLTGFDNLEEFINPDDIPDDNPTPTPTVTTTPITTIPSVSPTLIIITPGPSVIVSTTTTPTLKPTATKAPSTATPSPTAPWGGEEIKFSDSGVLFENIVTQFTDSIADSSSESGFGDIDLTPEVVQGIYDDAGNFIPVDKDGNIILGEAGIFDENGNFTPKTGSGYYDSEGVWHPTEIIPGVYDEEGNFVTDTGTYDKDGNFIADGGNEETKPEGYIDKDGNLIMPDGSVVSPDGIVHANGVESALLDVNGTEEILPFGKLTLDFNGNVIVWNEDGYYDVDGLCHLSDGSVGYYDSYGRFTKSRINPFSKSNYGFYDLTGEFHSFNTIYKTENDTTQLILLPDLGITVSSSIFSIPDSAYTYTTNGLVTIDEVVGYFNSNGDFLKSDRNAYKGGFFDEKGRWIDDFLIRTDHTKATSLSNGYFDKYGVYTSPNNDKGYFDETGKFIINRENPYKDGYYDWDGSFIEFGKIYYDVLGNVHKTGSDEIITTDGSVLVTEPEKGIKDKNDNWFNIGIVITPKGEIGHYNEFAEFIEGQVPYADGYYDADGNFFRYDGIVILADGTVGYFDENGEFHEGVQNGLLDANGNYILSDGTVITPDGTIGYYDENGVFHEGENPYIDGYYDANGVWHSLSEEGYIDKNGNTVLPNGVVITPDGTVGYYDENGVFHEGENPYENGYYDENGVWHSFDELPEGAYIDENGNLIMPDGTVITPDGTIGYYDENGVFHEGENPYEGGYYDENGNWVSSGYYDADGNYIMSDGTIIQPDGTVILPDGTIVSGYLDENGNLVITDNLTGSGYYDADGNLLDGENPDANGYYDADGNYYLAGDDGYYDENGTYHAADGTIGYYDENGVWHEGENPYVNGFYDENGVWHGSSEEQSVVGYYDENGVFHEGTNPYEGGYYDENGVWHDNSELGELDSNGNTILPNGVVLDENGVAGYYDENGIWHEGEIPYEDGYYDENGVWHDLEKDANGNTILEDGTIIGPDGSVIGTVGTTTYENDEPLLSYYDENGNLQTGTENPYEGGYYDANGNWHSDTSDAWIDANGNAHQQTESIGYYDADGNFHLNGEDGYYDANGTYHAADGTIGYYDKDGVFHPGEENPYKDGYYDANGNWHPAGETGYFDENGVWHDSVSNDVIGYYDENGVWHEGTNPYVNGYYDENGVWHGDGEPLKAYYDANGELQYGDSPYTDGWYDAEGNFHPNDGEGYFDSTGTYHTLDGDIGYYDADGVWHEGTNPNLYGYYDSDGNFHPAGDAGYYDVNGTYHAADGTIGYYDENGVWHAGQENPNENGWYDANGNFHPFDEDGYYDVDGNFHSNNYVVDKYIYGDDDYFYFTGTWRTATENAQYRLAGNTVQYTINKKSVNKIFSDTGIYVGLNSILEYEEGKDILHMIAISTKNTFIQDVDACMLIYNGRMISLTKEDKITVKTLQNIFENTNIEITVSKTRLYKKYAMIDAIESNRDIKLKFDDTIITPENPLLIIDNEAYVALNDVSDIIFYDYSIKPSGAERKITLNLKKSIPYEDLRSYMATTINFVTNNGEIEYIGKNGKDLTEKYTKLKPTLITLDSGYTTTYVPIKLIPRFTGCNACYDTINGYIDFNYSSGLPIIQKFYDTSEDIFGNNGAQIEVDANGTPITTNTGESIQSVVVNKEATEEETSTVDTTDYGELFENKGKVSDVNIE